MKQSELQFPLARASDPLTSHEAADRVSRGLIHTQRQDVLHVVRVMPGRTASEIARELGDQTNHVTCRRLPELEDEGFVRRGEPRPCRVTRFRAATWWPVLSSQSRDVSDAAEGEANA